jgi:hypothetical protein
MTRIEILEYRQRLCDILNNDNEDDRLKDLKQLAKKVGAGYVHTQIVGATVQEIPGGSVRQTDQNPISESELVQNISNAL